MKTYIGWWLQSFNYTDREDIPRSEEPDLVEGSVMIRYDNVSKSKTKTTVIEMDQITQVIDIETRIDAKPNDLIRTENGWLKVVTTENYLPEDKQSIVRMWPNRRSRLEVKRVYLA